MWSRADGRALAAGLFPYPAGRFVERLGAAPLAGGELARSPELTASEVCTANAPGSAVVQLSFAG